MRPPQGAPLLGVQELVAGHDRPLVGPVSLSIRPGEVVGLRGANGSGKTTLLRAIAGTARCFSGLIERAPGLRIAYQAQHPVRLPSMPLTGADLLRAADAVHLAPPRPLAALLGRRLDRLSGGQYQWLNVWCALAGAADLVLLDEPTNNLDPDGEALVAQTLTAGLGRRSVLLVSHESEFLGTVTARIIELQAPYRAPSRSPSAGAGTGP